MRNLMSLALLAFFFSLSLTVFADTSNDVTHAKDEVNLGDATHAIEPQQRGCRYGCCGAYAYGQCAACCSKAKASEAKTETEARDVVVEPQQGRCRFGCCGDSFLGRCYFCCRRPQPMEAEGVEANVVEPQQRWGGGCRYGCCGPWRYGQCAYCCRSPQAEAEVVEPQQRGCRYGCCGAYAYGQCAACCSKKMALELEKMKKKKEEAKP